MRNYYEEYDGEGTLTVVANLEYLNINLKFDKDDQSCYISQDTIGRR